MKIKSKASTSVGEPEREKLRNLQKYMPDGDKNIYEFGRLLSYRLSETVDSKEIHMQAAALMDDLERGYDDSNQPIESSFLIGQPQHVYSSILAMIPNIADAVFPEHFAKDVRDIQQKAMQRFLDIFLNL